MEPYPKVSVVIPTYNYGRYLDETIQSVLSQTFTDFELIIVDDCSTDDTADVVQKYLADKRVFFYCNESNLGLVGNWNKSLEYARGTYIKFLMADDQFRPDLLAKFVEVMERYPNVSLVTSYKQQFGLKTGFRPLPLSGLHNGLDIIRHTLHSHGWLGEPTLIMIRKENLKLGKFNPNYTWLPDWEMWLRQLTVGDCYIIPEPLCLIRNHGGQVTKMVVRTFLNYFEEYRLFKIIQEGKTYPFHLPPNEMNKLVKKKAEKCSNIIYKVLPKIYKKRNRQLLSKAYRIARKERVVFTPLCKLLQRKIAAKTNGKRSQTGNKV